MIEDSRPPLDADALRAGLAPPWTAIEVVEVTGSTNADLVNRPGSAAGAVLVAEYQHGGRGRLDRSWASPPRAGLLFSAGVRPPAGADGWGWLPLLTGVAVCDAVRASTGLAVGLKWPNDVLVDERKLAGILAQTDGDGAVIGVGLNVSQSRAELPIETATSLAIEGVGADRTALLGAILAELGSRYREWAAADGDAERCGLAADYRSRCVTIGRAVTVVTERGQRDATAVAVESDGRLRVRWADWTPGGGEPEQALAAGDIVHLRVAGGSAG